MPRVGVIGGGRLGSFHADKYRGLDGVQLVGIADIDCSRADAVAGKCGTAAFYDFHDLLGRVDAVSVAVPTQAHFEVTRACLEAGVHVLLEKPIACTLREADALVDLAEQKGLTLQIGHIERFNPAMIAAAPFVGRPVFIEADRISLFPGRGADVDVVLDLMIHDLDLTLHLVGEEPSWVHGVGVPVLTPKADIASVRMEFPGGCTANLTASRISVKTQRKIRIFQPEAYLSVDLAERRVDLVRRIGAGPGRPTDIQAQALSVSGEDALEQELKSFVAAVRNRTVPAVTGWDGRRALALALKIMEQIDARVNAWPGGLG
ncbi:MAG: Gfo/Idh/MocA family oxidoreductase [Pseudomonadota bacterium]